MSSPTKPQLNRNKPASQRPYVRRIFVALLTTTAALAWFFGARFDFSQVADPVSVRMAPAGARNQVYYGPSNSVAILPMTCTRLGEALSDGADGGDAVNQAPVDPVLAHGVAEAVFDLIVQNFNLQVSSPTSSFFFADSAESPAVLAERLKVQHILDGCVRVDGENLDIQLRLHDVPAKTIPWSQSYSGPLKQVHLFIHETAMQVSAAVEQQAAPALRATQSIQAETWITFLQGRYLYRQRDLESLRAAEALYLQVVESAPLYAPAWLGLAQVYLQQAWPGTEAMAGFEQARRAAARALAVDPDLAAAHLVMSRIGRSYDWDWHGARRQAQQALAAQAGNADILANASLNEFGFGQFAEAIILLESAISRDPLQLQHLLRLGLACEFARDYERALIVYRQLLGLKPDFPGVRAYRARVKLAQQKYESALLEAELEQQPFWNRYARILSLLALERRQEADLLLQEMITEDAQDAAFQIAEIYAFRGDTDAAFQWLEQAIEQRDGGISEMNGNFFLSSLTEDDRWLQLRSLVGLQQNNP